MPRQAWEQYQQVALHLVYLGHYLRVRQLKPLVCLGFRLHQWVHLPQEQWQGLLQINLGA